MAIARFTLACDRRFNRDGEQSADFISCVAFGKTAEHVEKYWHKGMKMGAVGRIQTGSYKNRDGQTVYTTDVIVEEIEFCESKAANPQAAPRPHSSILDNYMFRLTTDHVYQDWEGALTDYMKQQGYLA